MTKLRLAIPLFIMILHRTWRHRITSASVIPDRDALLQIQLYLFPGINSIRAGPFGNALSSPRRLPATLHLKASGLHQHLDRFPAKDFSNAGAFTWTRW